LQKHRVQVLARWSSLNPRAPKSCDSVSCKHVWTLLSSLAQQPQSVQCFANKWQTASVLNFSSILHLLWSSKRRIASRVVKQDRRQGECFRGATRSGNHFGHTTRSTCAVSSLQPYRPYSVRATYASGPVERDQGRYLVLV
jgi:hypothetical protein